MFYNISGYRFVGFEVYSYLRYLFVEVQVWRSTKTKGTLTDKDKVADTSRWWISRSVPSSLLQLFDLLDDDGSVAGVRYCSRTNVRLNGNFLITSSMRWICMEALSCRVKVFPACLGRSTTSRWRANSSVPSCSRMFDSEWYGGGSFDGNEPKSFSVYLLTTCKIKWIFYQKIAIWEK